MKNIVNYLDDYMSDEFEFESLNYKFQSDKKDIKKESRKHVFDDEGYKYKKYKK